MNEFTGPDCGQPPRKHINDCPSPVMAHPTAADRFARGCREALANFLTAMESLATNYRIELTAEASS